MNISRMFVKNALAKVVSLGVKGKLGLVVRDEFPELYEDGDVYSDEILEWSPFSVSPDCTIAFTEDGHKVTLSDFTVTGGDDWPEVVQLTNVLIARNTFPALSDPCSSHGVRMRINIPTPAEGVVLSGHQYIAAYDIDEDLGQLAGLGFGMVVSFNVSSNSEPTLSLQVVGSIMTDDGQVTVSMGPTDFNIEDTLYLTFDKGDSGFGRVRVYADSKGSEPVIEALYTENALTDMPEHLIFNNVVTLTNSTGWDNPPPLMSEVPPVTITIDPFVRTEQCD